MPFQIRDSNGALFLVFKNLLDRHSSRIAAKVLGDAEKKRVAIAAYLRDAEADAYSPSKHLATRRR
jgi:hypothetical protein